MTKQTQVPDEPEFGRITKDNRLQCPYCKGLLDTKPDSFPNATSVEVYGKGIIATVKCTCDGCPKQFRITNGDAARVTFPGKAVKV
jgi:hypothetical protein